MPPVRLPPLPARREEAPDGILTELTAALDLVATGLATRVVLVNVEGIQSVAPTAFVRARALGIAFTIERGREGRLQAVVGPRAG